MYFALIYDVADDYLERRTQFRAEHLALGQDAAERGEIVLGGAFADPADTALIIFKGDDPSVAETFARRPLREERLGQTLARTAVERRARPHPLAKLAHGETFKPL